MMAFDKEGSGVKMELVRSLSDFYVLHEKGVTFYDSRKVPLWSGYITNCLGSRPDDNHYVWAEQVQTWNKDGSKRKNSNGTGRKNEQQIFGGWYYSFGLTPEGVTTQPEASEQVLTQAQVDAKLKEYVTQRITELSRYMDSRTRFPEDAVKAWNLAGVFVTIYRELTE
jgi:hypothetical protein